MWDLHCMEWLQIKKSSIFITKYIFIHEAYLKYTHDEGANEDLCLSIECPCHQNE